MKSAAVWRRLPLPDGEVEVRLIRRPRQSIGLRVRDGAVELVAPPGVSERRLGEVLEQRRDWIAGHLRRQRELAAERAAPVASLQGQTLSWRCLPGQRRAVRRVGDVLQLCGVEEGDLDAARALIARYLKREAALRYGERLAHFAGLCRRQPAGWQLSSARGRWGSCTAAGVIRLNWRLIQAPPAILDYVIAHELAHLEHMNHSAAFWAETARLYPDWQAARRWLKQHGAGLFAFD